MTSALARNSLRNREDAPAAVRRFFDAVHEALARSLKALCQERASIGPYAIFHSGHAAAVSMKGKICACIRAQLPDKEECAAAIFLPVDAAVSLVGLSLYETSDEIDAKRRTAAMAQTDLEGLRSLADQLLCTMGTALRETLGGPYGFGPATVECREFRVEEATAILAKAAEVARVPLTIDPYEECSVVFAIPRQAADDPAGRPGETARGNLVATGTAAGADGKTYEAADGAGGATASDPAGGPPGDAAALERILKVQVPVIVLLAEKKARAGEVLEMTEGTVIQFAKGDEEPLDLLVNNKKMGRGVVVRTGKKLGLRIDEIGDAKEIIKKL